MRRFLAIFLLTMLVSPAEADDSFPYWASVRVAEANMRVGPGESYRINWVYHQPQLPLKVLRAMEGWRLVQDPDGARGWMLARFLSRERSAIVRAKPSTALYEKPNDDSKLIWKLGHGVVGKLGLCHDDWCALTVQNRKGYVLQKDLWGN